jgi:flagellar biosynthesis/type III secretory pathway protein FliH
MKQLEYNFNEIQREKEKQLINELNKEKYDFKKLIQKEKAKFFKELIELRQAVLVKAEDESNEIKEVAYQLGLKEGQKDGYETGVQEGYIAGQLEAESLKENAHKWISFE